jgi:uncharacterized membrane-anchored protein
MARTALDSAPISNKVPQVTLIFWIIKMMSTTVGETAADLLNFKLHLGLINTTAFMTILFAAALIMQLRAKRYIPSLYWSAVVCVSVFGTLATDILTDKLKVPLPLSSAVFGSMLLATFVLWYRLEKTLSIESINSRRRELFYWAAILVTFALGTAIGDLISEDMNVGYLPTALLFFFLIAITTAARFLFHAGPIATFWIAYVLTRPLGASCGDLLAKSPKHGALGFGTVSTSIVFFTVIIALVVWLEYQNRQAKP